MPLFPTSTPEVVIPQAERILQAMRQSNMMSLNMRKETLKRNFHMFWSSPETAQAICNKE